MAQGGYLLGLDLGPTCTTVAIQRPSSPARPVVVGRDGPAPSTLAVAPDGTILVGDAAERQALADPARVVRDVVRRTCDPVPLLVAGRSLYAVEGVALLATRLVEMVSEHEGGAPDGVAFAHPPWWGPVEVEAVLMALRESMTPDTVIAVPAPVATVVAGGLSAGPVAVLDVDTGVTVSVVHPGGPRPGDLLGPPAMLPHPDGRSVDDAVLTQVRRTLGAAWPRVDPADPTVRGAVSELRRRCAQATVALATRPWTDVDVHLPGLRTHVRLDRARVAELLLPVATEAAEMFGEAIDAAGVDSADIDHVVLTGASGRFHLLAEALGLALGRPVSVAPLPTAAIGAAMLCRDVLGTVRVAGGVADPSVLVP
jgi:molecular chaperone DnaK